MGEEKRQENYLTDSVRCSPNMNLPNPLNIRALRPTNFCLSIISKISDSNHQPNYDGKPDDRDSEFKEGFYKFHKEAAGSLRNVSLFVKARGIKELNENKFQN